MKRITPLLFLALAGCTTHTCPTGTAPCPAPATCETACLHGSNLGCDWAAPTPEGAQCVDVCNNATASGVPWDAAKWTTATTCQ